MWAARDKNGLAYLCKKRPIRNGEHWCYDGNVFSLDADALPNLTFENSPKKVELKIVEK